MVLQVSPKMVLSNNCPTLSVYDVVPRVRRLNRLNQLTYVRIFHYPTNMCQHVQLKTYSKTPLINKQSNAILKFCPIDIPLVQRWWKYSKYGVRFGDPKFDIMCIKYMRVNLPSFSRFFSLQIIGDHLFLLLSGKAAVLSIRKTFKLIDSAILCGGVAQLVRAPS